MSCDHSSDPVDVYSDSIASVAPTVDYGVLIEYYQDGIGIFLDEVDEDCAIQLLKRSLQFLQGA